MSVRSSRRRVAHASLAPLLFLAACSLSTTEPEPPATDSPRAEASIRLLERGVETASGERVLNGRFEGSDGELRTIRLAAREFRGGRTALSLRVLSEIGSGLEIVLDDGIVPASRSLQRFRWDRGERRPLDLHPLAGLPEPPRAILPEAVARAWEEVKSLLASEEGKVWLLGPEIATASDDDHGCRRAFERFWQNCRGGSSIDACDEALMTLLWCYFIAI